MGLPEILISFKSKAISAIKRSERGIVALILKDDTQEKDSLTYKSIEDLEKGEWSNENYEYIKMALDGTPNKIIVERIDEDEDDYGGVLKRLNNKKFNYLAVPGIIKDDTDTVASWIKSKRTAGNDKKTVKAVLPDVEGNDEGIINFTTGGIMVNDKSVTTAAFTARIAGVLAGLPFTRSATYYKFPEVDTVEELEEPGKAVDKGELILINDGENIKIGRGVNSLTETDSDTSDDFKSIRVVEVMDMIYDDIKSTFDDEYVGKLNNIYDNQALFITAVNAYFKGLAEEDILDPNFDNKAKIDTGAQLLAWESIGTDTSDWDDDKVKKMSFKKNVFLAGNIKIVDTMEDLEFNITIA